jgi:hypothetical protein
VKWTLLLPTVWGIWTFAMHVDLASTHLGNLVMSCSGDERERDLALTETLSKQLASQSQLSVNVPKLRDVASVETADGLIFQYKKMECIEQKLAKVPAKIVPSMRTQLAKMVDEHDKDCRNQVKNRSQSQVEAFDYAEITACQHSFNLSLLLGALNAYDPKQSSSARKQMREEFLAHQQDVRKKESLRPPPKIETSEGQR